MDTRLWILEPRDDLPAEGNPWEPWFDRCFGLIVEARTGADARRIAHENCVCTDQTILRDRGVFLDPAWTTCEELVPTGEEGLIMADCRLA